KDNRLPMPWKGAMGSPGIASAKRKNRIVVLRVHSPSFPIRSILFRGKNAPDEAIRKARKLAPNTNDGPGHEARKCDLIRIKGSMARNSYPTYLIGPSASFSA